MDMTSIMRGMYTRQAIRLGILLGLALGSWACTPPAPAVPTPTLFIPTPTATITPTPTLTPTATPLACLSQPGRVEPGALETTKPPQQYLIYLPPCYDEQTDERYPVLYLLHGQTSTDDQWVRLGIVQAADKLILSGQVPPFIMVFPDDRYWNLPPGPTFGKRLVESLIPYIDASYRTLGDCDDRALGGLSRGGGWTIQLGLTHPELFGALGLHSPAVFKGDASQVAGWMAAIDPDSFPRVWLDIGDRDKEAGYARLFEGLLSEFAVDHEFHVYSGDHTEAYWSRHVEEYLRWYSAGWSAAAEHPFSECRPTTSAP
ncbi:MAG: alpha/beta hydrolase, partial [Bacteroidota bacterium]